MPDLRTVLTETQRSEIRDAISAHRLWNGRCEACGAVSRRESDHMADVVIETLAGLPGVAVTQLPEPISNSNQWQTLIGGEPEDVYVRDTGEVVISGCAVLYGDETPDLAAVLLAAAALSVEGNTP